ncbi:hypothetical protein GGH96_006271 [Coemansia sp. RSA 1972]|nr:hypothetical protein GGH96_006271 [Coemansia sp. RSA 1972]
MTVSEEPQAKRVRQNCQQDVDWSLVKVHTSNGGYKYSQYSTLYGGAVVDKSLICKAFLDVEARVVRVCLPSGFGKSYNANIIKQFFNVLNQQDMPGMNGYNFGRNNPIKDLDHNVARVERMKQFESSLLRQELPAFFSEHFCRHPVIYVEFKDCESAPSQLFACISDFVFGVCKTQYIIIVEEYDVPLRTSEGRACESQVRQVYMSLLGQMFKSNDRLLKGMITGLYAPSLDEAMGSDLDGLLTVMPAVNKCHQPCLPLTLTNSNALGGMFGFTRSEIVELSKILKLSSRAGYVLNHVGGYDFGYSEDRFHGHQALTELNSLQTLKVNSKSSIQRMLFKANNTINRFVLRRRAEMILFVSRLTCDYDNGGSSCFVWPTLDLKAKHCKLADDELCNFVLNASVHPGKVDAESDMDGFVSLLLCLGYLSIGANNALCIPNNNMRNMWETVRVAATFGTPDQLEQDIAQRQLTDSLYGGIIRVLCSDFQFALTQLATSGSYSESTLLEFACRYIVSKLTLAQYTVASRPSNIDYDYEFLAHPQFNHTWKVTLLPFGRYIQTLTVYFHFVPITPSDIGGSGINSVKLIELANQALDKINSEQSHTQNSVRLDLGIAFGCGNAVIQHRLWN